MTPEGRTGRFRPWFRYRILCAVLVLLAVAPVSFAGSLVHLTDQEQQFLKAHPVITLGSDPDWQPYIIQNTDGSITGFDQDILNLVNANTGADFRLVAGRWQDILAKVKAGNIDGLSTSSATESRKDFLNFSDPYFSFPKTLIVANNNPQNIQSVNDLDGKRVGYQAGNAFNETILSRYPGITRVPLKSLKEIVHGLITGKIDAAIESNTVYLLATEGAAYLKTVDIFPDSMLDLVFSVRKDYPEAISIINKGLKAIPIQEKVKLIDKWFLGFEKQDADAIGVDSAEQEKTSRTEPALSTDKEGSSIWPGRSVDLTQHEKHYLTEKSVLTVGSLESFVPFSFSKDGIPAGYSVEYMKLIGRQIDKQVRFVTRPWSVLLEMLKRGEVDIIPHIAVTPERKETIDFTDFIHISFLTGFAVPNNLHIESIKDLDGRTIAVVNRYFLQNHLEKNHPEIRILITASTEDSIKAVMQGKADAAIGNIPNLNYFIHEKWLGNLKIITIEDPGLPLETQLPMAVAKGNRLLKSILEKANDSLPPEETLKLKQRWLFRLTDENTDAALSSREKRFIKDHPVIRFRIRPDRPPFEFSEDGKAAGLAVDYIRAALKYSGINPEFVISDMPTDDAFRMVEGNRATFDTLAFSVKNDARAERFAFGTEFLAYPMMIIGHTDSPFISKTADLIGRKVAVEKDFLTNQWLNRDYPGIEIVTAATTVDALQMVNDRKVDAYIGNLAIANYMMTHGGMKNLKIFAPSAYGNIKYSFIAPREWPELASILSKGYRSLPPEFHTTLQQKWFALQVIEKMDYILLWKIIGAVAFAGVWILWWNRSLMAAKKQAEQAFFQLQETQLLLEEQNAKLEKLSITDRLTGLYNRQKLDEVLQNEHARTTRYGKPFGVVITDIDHFKNVNDTFGHQFGDEVLKIVADILQSNVRRVDTVGRWGGEEFMVICPQIDRKGIQQVAENLRNRIDAHAFDGLDRLTASFGVSLCNSDDTIETVISRADNALYTSKQNGRNRVTFE